MFLFLSLSIERYIKVRNICVYLLYIYWEIHHGNRCSNYPQNHTWLIFFHLVFDFSFQIEIWIGISICGAKIFWEILHKIQNYLNHFLRWMSLLLVGKFSSSIGDDTGRRWMLRYSTKLILFRDFFFVYFSLSPEMLFLCSKSIYYYDFFLILLLLRLLRLSLLYWRLRYYCCVILLIFTPIFFTYLDVVVESSIHKHALHTLHTKLNCAENGQTRNIKMVFAFETIEKIYSADQYMRAPLVTVFV